MTPKTVKSKSNSIGRDTTGQNQSQSLSIGRQGPGTFIGQCRDLFTDRHHRRLLPDIFTSRRIIGPGLNRFIVDKQNRTSQKACPIFITSYPVFSSYNFSLCLIPTSTQGRGFLVPNLVPEIFPRHQINQRI